MLVFGYDVPLIEIVFALAIIMFILFVEVIIVIILLIKEMNKTKHLAQLIEKLSETILSIKKLEIEELDKIRKQ